MTLSRHLCSAYLRSSPQGPWLPQKCWLWRYLLAMQGRSAQQGGLRGVSAWCAGGRAVAGSLPQAGKAGSCLVVEGQRVWFLNVPFWKTFCLLKEESVAFNVKHKSSLENVLKGRVGILRIICSKYAACICRQQGTANDSTTATQGEVLLYLKVFRTDIIVSLTPDEP